MRIWDVSTVIAETYLDQIQWNMFRLEFPSARRSNKLLAEPNGGDKYVS